MFEAAFATLPQNDAEMARFFRVSAPIYYRDPDLEKVERAFSGGVYNTAATARNFALAADWSATSRLHEIRVPTLILAGRSDVFFPPEQIQALHRGIAGSDLVLFDRCGHAPFFEQPQAFSEAVKTWIGKTG